jgi:AcrR family transcriptional regulator
MSSQTDTYHHGDLANALLRAVEEIIREQGASHLSLREAARRAGVSHSAPAHHFGDKEGMLAAFAKEGFEGLIVAMVDPRLAAADIPERMEAMGTAYIRFATEHPAHYDVMFRSGPDKRSDPELHAAAEAAYTGLERKIAEVKEAGYFPDIPADDLAAFFWALVHGLSSLWIDGSFPQIFEGRPLDDLIESVLAVPFAERGGPPTVSQS